MFWTSGAWVFGRVLDGIWNWGRAEFWTSTEPLVLAGGRRAGGPDFLNIEFAANSRAAVPNFGLGPGGILDQHRAECSGPLPTLLVAEPRRAGNRRASGGRAGGSSF